jgi:hypothetical protein
LAGDRDSGDWISKTGPSFSTGVEVFSFLYIIQPATKVITGSKAKNVGVLLYVFDYIIKNQHTAGGIE